MSKKEAAIIMAFTGFTTLYGDDIKKYFTPYASKILGRPIGDLYFANEYDKRVLQKGAMEDFVKICARATDTETDGLV